jgi:hypothetical protein
MRGKPVDHQNHEGDQKLAPDILGSPQIAPRRTLHEFAPVTLAFDDFHIAASLLNLGNCSLADTMQADF